MFQLQTRVQGAHAGGVCVSQRWSGVSVNRTLRIVFSPPCLCEYLLSERSKRDQKRPRLNWLSVHHPVQLEAKASAHRASCHPARRIPGLGHEPALQPWMMEKCRLSLIGRCPDVSGVRSNLPSLKPTERAEQAGRVAAAAAVCLT